MYRSAFPVEERDLVTSVAVDLLRSDFIPEFVSLIAEVDGVVAGHVAFSPVVDSASDEAIGAILAPLAVCPARQRHGIGTTLVKRYGGAISVEAQKLVGISLEGSVG